MKPHTCLRVRVMDLGRKLTQWPKPHAAVLSGSKVVASTCLVAQCSGTAAAAAELELNNGGAELGDGWQGVVGRPESWGTGREDRDGRPRVVGFGGGVAARLRYRAEVVAAKFNRAAVFGGLDSVVGWAQI